MLEVADECQYCFDETGEESGELIKPCYCGGGDYTVHQGCLRKAIEFSYHKKKQCPICLYEYNCNTTKKRVLKDFCTSDVSVEVTVIAVLLIFILILDKLTTLDVSILAYFLWFLYVVFACIMKYATFREDNNYETDYIILPMKHQEAV